MNVFIETDYRGILRKIVEERKQIDTNLTFQALAEFTRIPKSYISKVATGKAHFNSDQLYSVCESLGLNQDQTEYLCLLLEHERSTCRSRKKMLQMKIKATQERFLESKEHLKANDRLLDENRLTHYYLDPLNQLVHICLSIPRYQRDIKLLAHDLGYPVTEIIHVLNQLEAMEIIGKRDGRYQTLIKKVHLPREKLVYRSWRSQSKILNLERLNRFSKPDDYSFSATFSAGSRTKTKIQAAFLEFLTQVEKMADDSQLEEAYQLNFDLFSWTSLTNK